MRYRRVKTPGACYFLTVNLANRKQSLLVENIDVLRSAFKQVKKNHAFIISAIVVLPDHLHTRKNVSIDWNQHRDTVGWGERSEPQQNQIFFSEINAKQVVYPICL